jgi:hypothetical protein
LPLEKTEKEITLKNIFGNIARTNLKTNASVKIGKTKRTVEFLVVNTENSNTILLGNTTLKEFKKTS